MIELIERLRSEFDAACKRAIDDCISAQTDPDVWEQCPRPYGTPAMVDKTKYKPSLIPAESLIAVAKLLTDSAQKHGDSDTPTYRGRTAEEYTDALNRHLLEYLAGQRVDASGHRTTVHIAANALILCALDTPPD